MPERQYDKEATYVQTVLAHLVEPLERPTGFVARRSKVTGVRFVQMVVLACLERADVTLEDMVAVGEALGVAVSGPGLNQRIDDEAVALLDQVLTGAVAAGVCAPGSDCALFARFSAVHIEDSSYLSLPPALADAWRGAGGNASQAGAKVLLDYDYLSGHLAAVEMVEGVCADQASRLAQTLAEPESLHLFDLGFFSQYRLAELHAGGSYFVSRLQYQTALYTLDQRRIDLEAWLTHCPEAQWEVAVLLGATVKLPVRLLAQRVPQAIAEQRRRKAKALAKRRGRTLAPQTLRLMEWNLFCTNVPPAWWGLEQVLAVYKLRWQVELLFKLFKSQAGLDQIGPWRPARVLCQLYARLIGLVVAHTLLAPLRFAGPRELSLPKAFRRLQRFIPRLALAIAQDWQPVAQVIQHLARSCLRLALKDKRTKDPSSYEQLVALGV
jgi:hypothetical protein